LEVGVTVPRDERKRRANNESDMECGDLSPLSFWRRGHSGGKSPHSQKSWFVCNWPKRHLRRLPLLIAPRAIHRLPR